MVFGVPPVLRNVRSLVLAAVLHVNYTSVASGNVSRSPVPALALHRTHVPAVAFEAGLRSMQFVSLFFSCLQ